MLDEVHALCAGARLERSREQRALPHNARLDRPRSLAAPRSVSCEAVRAAAGGRPIPLPPRFVLRGTIDRLATDSAAASAADATRGVRRLTKVPTRTPPRTVARTAAAAAGIGPGRQIRRFLQPPGRAAFHEGERTEGNRAGGCCRSSWYGWCISRKQQRAAGPATGHRPPEDLRWDVASCGFSCRSAKAMAGIALFAHAADENSTPPPLPLRRWK